MNSPFCTRSCAGEVFGFFFFAASSSFFILQIWFEKGKHLDLSASVTGSNETFERTYLDHDGEPFFALTQAGSMVFVRGMKVS